MTLLAHGPSQAEAAREFEAAVTTFR
jgi:hypothetical protein